MPARSGRPSRLYALTAWRDTPFFELRERAALGFCEAVVRMSESHVPEDEWAAVAAQLSDAAQADAAGEVTSVVSGEM
jgi:alkylhydroperoxidase family enzyme